MRRREEELQKRRDEKRRLEDEAGPLDGLDFFGGGQDRFFFFCFSKKPQSSWIPCFGRVETMGGILQSGHPFLLAVVFLRCLFDGFVVLLEFLGSLCLLLSGALRKERKKTEEERRATGQQEVFLSRFEGLFTSDYSIN